MIPWLKLLKALTILGYYLAFCLFLLPLKYLSDAITGKTVNTILNAASFHNLGNYSDNRATTVSRQALNNFPSWPFSLLMAAGAIVLIIGILLFLRSFTRILQALITGHYFNSQNIGSLKKMVTGQLIITIGNVIIALANQLPVGWLYQLHVGFLGANWDTVLGNLFWLIILSVITGLYRQAVEIKQDNDLTV